MSIFKAYYIRGTYPDQIDAKKLTKVPKQKKFVEAEYPKEAVDKGLEAEVVLLLDINDKGTIDAVAVAERLLASGAEVRAVDPHVVEGNIDRRVVRVDATADEIQAADCVVLLVDHDGFDYDGITRGARRVLDTRNRLQGGNVEHL